MKWQIGRTSEHWLYEVWINGERAPDAIAVDSVGRAIVMRWEGNGYDRDAFDRVKADLVVGRVDLRLTNPPSHYRSNEYTAPDPFEVIVCQTQEVLRIGTQRPVAKLSVA